jgi:hypothetical protein
MMISKPPNLQGGPAGGGSAAAPPPQQSGGSPVQVQMNMQAPQMPGIYPPRVPQLPNIPQPQVSVPGVNVYGPHIPQPVIPQPMLPQPTIPQANLTATGGAANKLLTIIYVLLAFFVGVGVGMWLKR